MDKAKYITLHRHATRWEAGGARAPTLFGGSVNPISTRGGTLSPPSTMCPLRFSNHATALLMFCVYIEPEHVDVKRQDWCYCGTISHSVQNPLILRTFFNFFVIHIKSQFKFEVFEEEQHTASTYYCIESQDVR